MMQQLLTRIVGRTPAQTAGLGAGGGFVFCALFFLGSNHFRGLLLNSGEHFGLVLFYFLTPTLFGVSMGHMARRNAEWLKTLTDWKNRDTVRPFTLAPYPQQKELQIVIGEKHDDRGRRINEPSWFCLQGSAVYTGILVVGDTGSGKTTCAGFPWLEKMIQSGLGGLVLDAGGSYVRFIRRQMAAAGREQDLIVIEPGGPHKYNPVAKADMSSADLAGWLYQVIANLQGSKAPTGTEAFWSAQGKSYTTVMLELCRLVDSHVTLELLYRLNTDEKAKQKIILQLERELAQGTTDERDHRIKHVLHYFSNEWAQLAGITRGSIPTTFNGAVQMFSSDYDLCRTFCPHPQETGVFGGFTNECFDGGKVVVLNMPLRAYPESGRVLATLLKLDFQRGVLRRTEGRSEAEITRPTFLVIDEAQNYVTASRELGDAMYLAESRKNKPINIYMSQSIDSFKNAFHDSDACNVFLNLLRTKLFMSQEGPDSQKMCADLCGKATQWKKTITESEAGRQSSVNYAAGGLAHEEVAVSKTVAYAEHDEYLFRPQDFRNLPQFIAVASAFDGSVKLKPCVVYMKPLFVDGAGNITERHYETWFTGEHAQVLGYADTIPEAV
jgi:hypothetical protein